MFAFLSLMEDLFIFAFLSLMENLFIFAFLSLMETFKDIFAFLFIAQIKLILILFIVEMFKNYFQL